MIATLLLVAMFIGFTIRIFTARSIVSWVAGASIMPVATLFNQFIFSYQGEGALLSLGIAILVGGIYGAIASTLGVLLARHIRSDTTHKS